MCNTAARPSPIWTAIWQQTTYGMIGTTEHHEAGVTVAVGSSLDTSVYAAARTMKRRDL